MMAINVRGTWLTVRAIGPLMHDGGAIVTVSSDTIYWGAPRLLHYVTSKSAIVGMTRSLAKELGGDNVLVNTVAPGFTMSDGVLDNPVQLEQLTEISAKARVLVRDQYPEDIVGAVVFFASEDAAFVTGQSTFLNDRVRVKKSTQRIITSESLLGSRRPCRGTIG